MSTAPNGTTAKPTQETQVKQATNEPEHPVDARLRRLNDQHLPTAPYILSSPGSFNHDFVQRRYPQNALNWRKHSLFKPGEEELQYLTFKDRSEDSDVRSMYAKGGWDDGNGRIAAPEEPYSRTSSDATPQQGQAPKRKITLAEYQKKDRSKATTPAPKVIAPELTEGAKRKDKEAVPNATVEDVTKLKQAEHRGQKR